jgi:type II secretory pathway component PulK
MRSRRNKPGSVLLMVVFITALLAATVMGHLQISAEEIQLMRNHVCAAEALATAEAGLNDALARLREDSSWTAGFTAKPFNEGSYTVTVEGSTVTATGTTSQGFVARVEAELTISSGGPPYMIRIDSLRINE